MTRSADVTTFPTVNVRLLAPLAGAVLALALALMAAPARAAIGVAKWEAGTCNGSMAQVKECEYTSPHSAFYTQAAGHPPWGLTGFELAHSGSGAGRVPAGKPLKRIRVDVPPGLAADPQTLEACNREKFKAKLCPPGSEAGFVELEAVTELPVLGNVLLTLKGKVYNLAQEPGLPLLFGIEVEGVEPLVESVDLYLEGHVSYAFEPALAARGIPSGDFHEWFEINNIPPKVKVEVLHVLPLTEAPLKTLKSKLFFNGQAGKGNFLTLPSVCGAPSLSTSYLEVESETGEIASVATVPPVSVEKCGNVPFAPAIEVKPQSPQYDQPDGAITEVKVPQHEAANEINTADILVGHALFPAGLTLNPSAAHGLEACAPAQVHFESATPAECPAGSRIGKVTIETDLPKGSLTGGVYLGAPGGTPITGPPYTIYIVAESVYAVKVKVEADVTPDPTTGRLQVDVNNSAAHPFNLPQLPFSSVVLELSSGEHAPLANPLVCGTAQTESLLTPYTTEVATALSPTPFVTGGCPSPLPFSLEQSTQSAPALAGAFTSYTFNLTRADGQQYLQQIRTVLPPGLVGAIPAVPLCGEPQANAGTCPSTSEIGTASVTAGAGEPFPFAGKVYLTGPYDGSPYGLSIAVPAVAGPFNLGTVVTRVGIGVEPYSGRVVATSNLPTIAQGVGKPSSGVPLRLRGVSVAVTRPGFLFNPTNCGPLATESTLTSTLGATQSLSSPFQVGECGKLAFKPSFKVATSARTSKANGASLQVTVAQGSVQANMRSVFAQLPVQLPARLTTLQKACTEAAFAANPFSCPSASKVGSATVTTPVLPGKLSGPAYLVSHGGAAFPDLDLILEGDGVRVILVGNTNIKKGVTSSTFASIPDVPVSSFVLTLPVGPHSALAANGSLCAKPLIMPTTITAQSGAVVKQNTHISVSGCPVEIVSHRVVGDTAILKVKTFAAGSVSAKAAGGKANNKRLRTVYKRLAKARTFTLKVPLSHGGLGALRRHRLKLRVRVGFVPSKHGEPSSAASATVVFR